MPIVVVLLDDADTQGLEKTLKSLAGLGSVRDHDIYVSQDKANNKVNSLIVRHQANAGVKHITHATEPTPDQLEDQSLRYSRHVGLAIRETLARSSKATHVIVVESGVEFSPDVLNVFQASAEVMARDESAWIGAAWNPLSLRTMMWEENALTRTSYFAGGAWMLRKELWEELGAKWPLVGTQAVAGAVGGEVSWITWLNSDSVRQGRDCITPEVSRVRKSESAVPEDGLLHPLFAHLAVADVDADPTRFSNILHLRRGDFEKTLKTSLDTAKEVPALAGTLPEMPPGHGGGVAYKIIFDVPHYPALARRYHAPEKWPVGSYRGVLTLKRHNSVVMLVERSSPLLPPSAPQK